MQENSLIIEKLPIAYAYHQIVTDDTHNPIDYIFLKINHAFEQMTNLKREKILGKRVTEVLPDIKKDKFDWIKLYGNIALSGNNHRFETFSHPLQRWYQVNAYSEEKGFFSTVFSDITNQKIAEESLRDHNNKMKLLLDVSQEMMIDKETSSIAQTIVNGITKLAKLDTAAIYLLRKNMLHLEATNPPLPPDFPEFLKYAQLKDHPHINRAILNKEPLILPDTTKAVLTDNEKEVCELRNLRSILYIPLVYKGKSIGILIPASISRLHHFTKDEINLCKTLGSHAALSVAEASLFEKQQQYIAEIKAKNDSLKSVEKDMKESLAKNRQVLSGIITSMGTLMSKKDNYTAEHQIKVAKLAVAIAKEMGLAPEKIEGLKLAAEIHDIGKISIPAEILTKTGQLTDLEFQIIQSHAEIGYEILKNINFPWPLAQIVGQHHEKINGSGYPKGLAKNQILIEARILCVADVVEAIASHRPYRPALGIEVALAEILAKKGILFDEEVVDACLKLFKKQNFDFN